MSPAQAARARGYQGATQAQRLGGFGASLLLHLSLLAAVIFVSGTPARQYDLDTPVLSLTQLTIGAAGSTPEAQPERGREPAPARPEPAAAEPPAEPPAEPTVKPDPQPVPQPIEPVPVPKLEELEKQPEAPAAEPEAPAEPPAAEPEPEPEEPAGPTDEELLAAALAGAQAEAKPALKVSGGQSLLDDALRNAGNAAGGERIVTGESGSGVGVLALYEEVVAMQIRRHFTTRPHVDGRVFEVKVLVEITAEGELARTTVLEPSGDPTLDANVLRAVREVGRFEPPPGKKAQRLELLFTSDIYAGQ